MIGSGGLGCVWRARAENGAIVAIKEPLTGTPQDQVNLEKLQVEALVLEKLTGPTPIYKIGQSERNHIVRFCDVEGDPPCRLILEFVDGKSMEKKFGTATGEILLSSEIDSYAMKLLNTIKALHENNILHRDISPHNLICTTRVETDPVLVDFGTVKEGYNQISASVLHSQIIKAGYSAPELSLGLANPSSDLYSVAATLLFLYTGVNPQYVMTSKFELDEKNKSIQKIPQDRRDTIKKTLSYHPSDRYQTADDMLNAMTGRPVLTSRPHIVASGRKYELTGKMIIGRQHVCGEDCKRKGYYDAPEIGINDPGGYVGRHHARLQLASDNSCWVQDLHAMNRTAMRRATEASFEILLPGKGYKLLDGDIVALAYSEKKGPYMTISYHTK